MNTRTNWILCILTMLVLPWVAANVNAAAATHFVNVNTGSDANNGLTPTTAKKTIQSAIGSAAAGDTIVVAPGVYQESVSISVSLTLQGAQSGVDPHRAGSNGPNPPARDPANASTESIIDGNLTGTPVSFNAANSVLDGFTIKNGYPTGIIMSASFGGMQILNNIVTGNAIGIYSNCNGPSLIGHNLFDSNNVSGSAGGAAIYTDVITQDLTIDANEFRNHLINNPSIFASTLPRIHTNLTYTHNYLHDNISGVFAQAINGALVSENEISTNGTDNGFTLGSGCSNVLIANNKLDNNQSGVEIADFVFFIYFPNADFGPNSDVTIQQNSFVNCSKFGVRLGADPDPTTYTLGASYYGNVPASENWWGAASGPANRLNPLGSGSPVSDLVDFSPWLIDGTNTTAAIGFHPNLLPALTTVNPVSATAGTANLVLSVTGTNFVQGVTNLTWNGSDRLTFVTSNTNASMFLLSTDTNAAGTAQVQAVNTWTGGGFSNVLTYTIVAAPPVIQSAVAANPNPATVNQNVTFSVAATDPASLPLTYTWNFGDGSTGAGASVVHAYTAPGIYTATVTVTNGVSSTTSSTTVTAIAGAVAPTVFPMTVTKQRLKAANPSVGKDRVQLIGGFMLPAGTTSLTGSLTLTVGGVSKIFALSSNGSGRVSGGTFRLKVLMKRKVLTSLQATFQGTLSGNFLTALVAAGYKAGTNGPVVLSAQIFYTGQTYATNVTFNLKSSAHGVTGK